ncbi:MAG: pyruvate dehydrogenase (acetyl-transferring) E1 component subunit alpha [Candidatus Handelsmanbacteria bacterium RIFCSPLOWO2_12_FULL_64_10]|uniref:Pyruvate dehydrogenase (Acetyl-transferring) E1 component subunit alpha n=1 Tax=Handelsmanbacteria sp. (strain RIFCSPLOWO2_12_FULL_64_10) TaxID=1817868 RepID=A0A1F6C9B3_HANXR|nr:MAG: pyruvate dehydrogenase (acetyl-transferring) E1 component subunit alpha [Candidatus Handelsmanbacteria bacterium RIFCSPLOWO2_12_FULL_64_10]
MAVDKQLTLKMYRDMLRIRRFEEQIWNVYTLGLMHGLAHLYIGEEAVAVGVCSALRDDDYITSTHRGHGHCIAKGGKLDRMMAEVMGKVTGYCRGKGGSMHIADMSLGILGANGIVGGGFGIATGAALSAKYRKTDQVVACFFGDGGANQGIFFEVMNYAAIWGLPVIYVCENNQYGEYTAVNKVTAGKHIADRATPFGIPGRIVDGNDVIAVYGATAEAVKRARAGEGPSLIECETYRYRGHHVNDPGLAYRSKEEVEAWMKRDPIERLKGRMLAEGQAREADLSGIDEEVQKEVADAVESAKASPYPDVKEVSEHVFA